MNTSNSYIAPSSGKTPCDKPLITSVINVQRENLYFNFRSLNILNVNYNFVYTSLEKKIVSYRTDRKGYIETGVFGLGSGMGKLVDTKNKLKKQNIVPVIDKKNISEKLKNNYTVNTSFDKTPEYILFEDKNKLSETAARYCASTEFITIIFLQISCDNYPCCANSSEKKFNRQLLAKPEFTPFAPINLSLQKEEKKSYCLVL